MPKIMADHDIGGQFNRFEYLIDLDNFLGAGRPYVP